MKLRKNIKQISCPIGLGCGVLLSFSCVPHNGFSHSTTEQGTSQTLIIYDDYPVRTRSLLKASKNHPATLLYAYKQINGIVISLLVDKDVEQAQQDFAKIKDVLSVQRNRINQLH